MNLQTHHHHTYTAPDSTSSHRDRDRDRDLHRIDRKSWKRFRRPPQKLFQEGTDTPHHRVVDLMHHIQQCTQSPILHEDRSQGPDRLVFPVPGEGGTAFRSEELGRMLDTMSRCLDRILETGDRSRLGNATLQKAIGDLQILADLWCSFLIRHRRGLHRQYAENSRNSCHRIEENLQAAILETRNSLEILQDLEI